MALPVLLSRPPLRSLPLPPLLLRSALLLGSRCCCGRAVPVACCPSALRRGCADGARRRRGRSCRGPAVAAAVDCSGVLPLGPLLARLGLVACPGCRALPSLGAVAGLGLPRGALGPRLLRARSRSCGRPLPVLGPLGSVRGLGALGALGGLERGCASPVRGLPAAAAAVPAPPLAEPPLRSRRLGGLDGGDQLALAHGAGALEAQRAGQLLQLGQDHRVQPAARPCADDGHPLQRRGRSPLRGVGQSVSFRSGPRVPSQITTAAGGLFLAAALVS